MMNEKRSLLVDKSKMPLTLGSRSWPSQLSLEAACFRRADLPVFYQLWNLVPSASAPVSGAVRLYFLVRDAYAYSIKPTTTEAFPTVCMEKRDM